MLQEREQRGRVRNGGESEMGDTRCPPNVSYNDDADGAHITTDQSHSIKSTLRRRR